jgi:hypothetical protein
MVERFQDQLATTALSGQGPETAVPIHHRGDQTMIVDPEPAPARLEIEPADDIRAIRPVACRRTARPRPHLVAIGGDQNRPRMIGATQDDEGTHGFRLQSGEADDLSSLADISTRFENLVSESLHLQALGELNTATHPLVAKNAVLISVFLTRIIHNLTRRRVKHPG